MRYITAIVFLSLLVSCAPDDPRLPSFDDTAEDSAMVDTFSVKRPQHLTDEQQQQLNANQSGVDSIINDASLLINSGNADTSTKIQNADLIVEHPDVAASYPGGEMAMENYLSKHIVYPLVAFQNDVKGIVYLKVVIEKDGKIGGIKVLRGLGFGCDESAQDCVRSMPNWIAAKKNDVNVRSAVVIPVTFGADKQDN
ncbi:MAG TPA: energy transducer TonB [Bacteroidia bacterium]|jgi:protein TonB|nr:energy transducer TonB [Bacteroidia bacterium]